MLAIALILWYRMRKARMLNETMLKLAEKGIVPPAEALSALAGNSSAPLAAAPSAAPIYEQAKQIRRRAAWSDLRKGVILGGIGLGLTLYSMLDDGTPNGLGLVLLFVGIGYLVLWWFEERQFAPRGGGAGADPAGAPVRRHGRQGMTRARGWPSRRLPMQSSSPVSSFRMTAMRSRSSSAATSRRCARRCGG